MPLDPDLLAMADGSKDGDGWLIEVVLVQVLRDMQLAGDVTGDKIGSKVFSRLYLDFDGIQFPNIQVHDDGLSEQKSGHDTDRTESWIHKFSLDLTDVVGSRVHERKRMLKRWRWNLISRFERKAEVVQAMKLYLPGVWDVSVMPGVLFAQDKDFEHVFSRLEVWVYFERPRMRNL